MECIFEHHIPGSRDYVADPHSAYFNDVPHLVWYMGIPNWTGWGLCESAVPP